MRWNTWKFRLLRLLVALIAVAILLPLWANASQPLTPPQHAHPHPPLALPPTAADEHPVEPHSLVTIAVFYTPTVARHHGGDETMLWLIDRLIITANQVFQESGVALTLVLVAAETVDYNEIGLTRSVVLEDLVGQGDGKMDEVHLIRNQTRADVGMLLIAGGGGLSYVFPNSRRALAVSGVPTSTFLHELGHIMGLVHDRYETGCETNVDCTDAYAFGYINLRGLEPGAPQSAVWRTIMAYDDLCWAELGQGCPSILRFSNPRQTYQGDPLGVPHTSTATGRDGPADAVRVLNATRTIVAQYRTNQQRAVFENPAPDSAQSGIGIISGWDCEAAEIHIGFELEDGFQWSPWLRLRAATGLPRRDTLEVCGHSATGFTLLWNWNRLGAGTHTVQVFRDGEVDPFAERQVTVTTFPFNEEFLRDVEGECVVQNFPYPGYDTVLEWEEALQNFVITGVE